MRLKGGGLRKLEEGQRDRSDRFGQLKELQVQRRLGKSQLGSWKVKMSLDETSDPADGVKSTLPSCSGVSEMLMEKITRLEQERNQLQTEVSTLRSKLVTGSHSNNTSGTAIMSGSEFREFFVGTFKSRMPEVFMDCLDDPMVLMKANRTVISKTR